MQNMMDINVVLLQWSIHILIKKIYCCTNINEIILNKELAEELHKPIFKKFKEKYTHVL